MVTGKLYVIAFIFTYLFISIYKHSCICLDILDVYSISLWFKTFLQTFYMIVLGSISNYLSLSSPFISLATKKNPKKLTFTTCLKSHPI